jgi:hypothetical protein
MFAVDRTPIFRAMLEVLGVPRIQLVAYCWAKVQDWSTKAIAEEVGWYRYSPRSNSIRHKQNEMPLRKSSCSIGLQLLLFIERNLLMSYWASSGCLATSYQPELSAMCKYGLRVVRAARLKDLFRSVMLLGLTSSCDLGQQICAVLKVPSHRIPFAVKEQGQTFRSHFSEIKTPRVFRWRTKSKTNRATPSVRVIGW